MEKSRTIKILDGMIYFFMVLFLLSLTNSIFVNQIGYYFALIVILVRLAITRENQFQKTGMEIAFIWFLAAEIISLIITQDHGGAIHNALKKALLIPLIYTTIAATPDLERGKKYFKIYIGASLLTVLIYLFFSYRFYIYNLYSIEQSGPSLFQYPITAAEILTFTVVFLFAFFVNEKTSVKNKILLFVAFTFSLLALVSTYKRTGWTGAIFGIFIVLLIKKQWKIIIPFFLVIIALFVTQKNISQVKVFDYSPGKLTKNYSYNTDGRAYDITPVDSIYYVSDYENGLVKYRDKKELSKMKLAAPVGALRHWKDKYYVASLIDSRFVLLKKTDNGMKVMTDFLTPGITYDFKIANGFCYVIDNDSGLTVFRNPKNLLDTLRFSNLNKYTNLFADSSNLILYSAPRKISLVKLNKGLPADSVINFTDDSDIDEVFFTDQKLFVSDGNGLKLFDVSSSGITVLDSLPSIKHLYHWDQNGNKLFTADLNGNFYELKYPVGNKIEILATDNLGFNPQSITYNDGKIYTSFVKRSRLLSIFDPYHPSNTVRFELWKAGWKMFKDHPLFGVGDIDLQKLYKQYKKPYDKELQGHMHNNFIHVLVTLGLFGFLAFCYLIFKIISIEWKIYNETKDIPFISSYAIGALAAFCAFLVAGLTEMNFGDHEIITLVWFSFGLNYALYNYYKKHMKKEKVMP
jgi:hypothetical protein